MPIHKIFIGDLILNKDFCSGLLEKYNTPHLSLRSQMMITVYVAHPVLAIILFMVLMKWQKLFKCLFLHIELSYSREFLRNQTMFIFFHIIHTDWYVHFRHTYIYLIFSIPVYNRTHEFYCGNNVREIHWYISLMDNIHKNTIFLYRMMYRRTKYKTKFSSVT